MIEKILSVQDIIGIVCLVGALIKTVQFYYFDPKNKSNRRKTW